MNKGDLNGWLQHLESLHPSEIELGLGRVEAVADRLDLLAPTVPVVTIAGTNGKGSTAAVLEALLIAAGARPGTFTSPHFLRFNERIRIDGEEASDREIIEAFGAIEQVRREVSLTYFEFSTLAALWLFRRQQVGAMVLEVGLGGRLDATNIISPEVAIITSIALDHQDWLGDSLGEIAREKAGILRAGKAALIADPNPPAELLDRAEEVGAVPILRYGADFGSSEDSRGLFYVDPEGTAQNLTAPESDALLPQNLCAAVQALSLLGERLSGGDLQRALMTLRVPGRREMYRYSGLDYVLDVAHNPASVIALLDFLRMKQCRGRTFALFSAMKDKDIPEMLAPALEAIDIWFLADQPDVQRAVQSRDTAEILDELGESNVRMSADLQSAFRAAQAFMVPGDRLVVFGSFHTVAAIMPLLESDRQNSLAGVVS